MNIAKYIDYAIHKPYTSSDDIQKACEQARVYKFKSLDVNPNYVEFAAKELKGSGVCVCAAIAFPFGGEIKNTKVYAARQALNDGAQEIDVVINLAAMKNKDYKTVFREMKALRRVGKDFILKFIIETYLLTKQEKIKACEFAADAKADFVKTSTGFLGGGATAEDVLLMKESISKGMAVKASGGIRDLAALNKMIKAGATRIGTSAAPKIMREFLR